MQGSRPGLKDTSTHLFPNLPLPATRPPLPARASLAPPPALLTGPQLHPQPICGLSPSTCAASEDPLRTLPAPYILQDTSLLPTHRVCHKVRVRTKLKNLFRIQIKFRPRPAVQGSSCGAVRKRRGYLRGASGLRILRGERVFFKVPSKDEVKWHLISIYAYMPSVCQFS